MKNINPLGLFDDHFLTEKLRKLGNPLEKLDKYIDWKIFEEAVNPPFDKQGKDIRKGGRPCYNKLMLFKALTIQGLYNLSDQQLEYQILDRSSFKQFLGLKKSDRVPDSRTFWHFREQLIAFGSIESLFRSFNSQLDKSGVFANEGKMVDCQLCGSAPTAEYQRWEQRDKRRKNTSVMAGEHP